MASDIKKADKKIEASVQLFKKGLDLVITKSDHFTDPQKRLDLLAKGLKNLSIFVIITVLACIALGLILLTTTSPISELLQLSHPLIWSIIAVVLVDAFIFWKGIILVYLMSQQLGVRLRALGAILGLIPIANLIMLFLIMKTAHKEYIFESAKLKLNQSRKSQQICKTKYPIILIHGIFFRDSSIINYWGRIPDELISNGATIYYGNHNSASPIMVNAQHLAQRIKTIVETTGCGKVNIIAHSKGGLDSRAMIAKTDAAPYIASLTTINTPHRGCIFADYLLEEFEENQKQAIANFYNTTASSLGDNAPDFITSVTELGAKKCKQFNEEIPNNPNVFYQSVGSLLNGRKSAQVPLNFTHPLVECFDGPNDGLVGENSFEWGEKFTLLTTKGKRGLSHGDVIDLNRENIDGFDVREFYVQVVSDLKARGF